MPPPPGSLRDLVLDNKYPIEIRSIGAALMRIVRAYGEIAELIFSCTRTVLPLCWLQQARHRPRLSSATVVRIERRPSFCNAT